MSERFFQHHTSPSVEIILGSIAMFLLMSIDRITKIVAPTFFAEPRILIPSVLELRFVGNSQLFFFQHIPPLVLIGVVGIVMVVVMFLFIHALITSDHKAGAYGLLLLGAWSNWWDRIVYGMVIDFIHVPWWSTFNLADVYIFVGVLLLFFQSVITKKYETLSAHH